MRQVQGEEVEAVIISGPRKGEKISVSALAVDVALAPLSEERLNEMMDDPRRDAV